MMETGLRNGFRWFFSELR